MTRFLMTVGALALAAGSVMAQAQQTPPAQGERMQTPGAQGMHGMGDAKTPEQMKQACQQAMQDMQTAKAECDRADQQLDQQMQKVKQAQGQEKIDAMASAMEMMAKQRKEATQRAEAMMPKMMQHMQMHAAMMARDPQQGQQAMADCMKMMQSADSTARPAGQTLP